MSALRLKLSGLSDSDRKSIHSMLRLSADLLTQPWELTEEEVADLTIYAFDSHAGRQAWQNRGPGFSALLTNTGNIVEPVDIVLKKPLRKSNFSEALNLIEEKIRTQQQASTIPQLHQTPEAMPAPGKKSGLLDLLPFRKSPAKNLPPLSLGKPHKSGVAADTIKDPALLQAWIAQLPADSSQRAGTLLSNLQPLNQLVLKPALYLQLLELYREAVNELLFTRDIAAVKRDLYLSSEHQRIIRNVSELIEALTRGYTNILSHFYHRGDTPNDNSIMLLCLNRATEQLSMQILHAFYYYRSAPVGVWQQLHEFYLYHEQAGSLRQTVSLKEGFESDSFFSQYAQVLLTTIADPYSLAKFDIFRLFRLMAQFTDEVVISHLSEKQISITSNFLLTGHFCIDCKSDGIPVPMVKTPASIRAAEHTRLMDIQAVLRAMEREFKLAASGSHKLEDIEVALLRKSIPKFNTTIERRYHRVKTSDHRNVQIVLGIDAIHQSMTGELSNALRWRLVNQSSGGVMASRASADCYRLSTGDLVSIYEADYNVRLANIRWLLVDADGETQIGLEFIEGKPTPALCRTDDEDEPYPALLLTVDKTNDDTASLITTKGLFSPKRVLSINSGEETFNIVVSQMLDSTLDYELFTYKIKPGS